jgi:hypothetical protein
MLEPVRHYGRHRHLTTADIREAALAAVGFDDLDKAILAASEVLDRKHLYRGEEVYIGA